MSGDKKQVDKRANDKNNNSGKGGKTITIALPKLIGILIIIIVVIVGIVLLSKKILNIEKQNSSTNEEDVEVLDITDMLNIDDSTFVEMDIKDGL